MSTIAKLTNLRTWLHGLFAAFISAFASAASGAIALPTVFTFDKNGFINMAKLATVPAMLAVFAYLKSSPIPALTMTATETSSISSSNGDTTDKVRTTTVEVTKG